MKDLIYAIELIKEFQENFIGEEFADEYNDIEEDIANLNYYKEQINNILAKYQPE